MVHLLMIPFHDFKLCQKEGFRTRDAHLYTHFSKDPNVGTTLVLNRPTSLIEVLTFRKKVRTEGELVYKSKNGYLTKINEKVFVIDVFVSDTVKVIRQKYKWIPVSYNYDSVYNFLQDCLNYLKIKSFAVYTSTPFSIPIISKLNAEHTLLDAVDNLTKFGIYQPIMNDVKSYYAYAKTEFNTIVCNSTDIYSYLSPGCKANISIIPNGVDIEQFSSPLKEVPEDTRKIKKPIVGFGGKMQAMFDIPLLKKVAGKFPDVSFVLVGKILDKRYMRNIESISNVYYLGDKVYDKYSDYVKTFDICIIPYNIETAHGVDPIKFYEYMAANKPIVSTNIGEISKYHNGKSIYIANNHEEFSDYIFKALENLHRSPVEHQLPKEITWANKSREIIHLLSN